MAGHTVGYAKADEAHGVAPHPMADIAKPQYKQGEMSVFEGPKIDCHAHVLDPAHFPYGKEIAYKPAGQEIGTTTQLLTVMKTYGTRHTLLVQPNSGYGSDNSCMLDAIRQHPDIFKGIAIADLDADLEALRDLKRQGIIGIAFNPTFHGTALLCPLRRHVRETRRTRHVRQSTGRA